MADWTLTTGAVQHLDEHNQFDHTDLASLTEGRVLGVSSGVIKQIDPMSYARKVTTNTSVVSGDTVILVDTSGGVVTITLGLADDLDLESVLIKRIAGASNVVINRSGTDLINTDGATDTSITLGSVGAQWSATAVAADDRWYTVGSHGDVT